MKTVLLSLLSLMTMIACAKPYTDLSVNDFEKTAYEGAAAIVDVRTPEEYAAGHLRDAALCDWKAEGFLSAIQAKYPTEVPLAIYCRTGRRSAEAAAALANAGYTVYNLQGGIEGWTAAGKPTQTYEVETFFTEDFNPVTVTLLKHGTLAISYQGATIQIDPVSGLGKPTDYAKEFPKADAIFITHEHGDHLDKEAVAALYEEGKTTLIANPRSIEQLGFGIAQVNGDEGELPCGIQFMAVPAYNYSEGHTNFHPKGRDNGYVFDIEDLRIYVAGDTEDIPELAEIEDVDIAFLPVNQPYTMTVEQCVKAAKVLKPRVLIPYHFSNTELSELPELLPGIEVLLRQMQ